MSVETNDEEELYFAAVDQQRRKELRDKLASAASEMEEQQKIASGLSTDDLSVAERVKGLGFDGDSARVFDLLPLVHVAWADGSVQRGERAAILGIVKKRGIEADSDAFRTIASLLEERPSDAYMRQSLAVLRELTGGVGNERSGAIVDLCIEVAAASGGFLGLGQRIGDEEKTLIDEIVGTLGNSASDSFKRELG